MSDFYDLITFKFVDPRVAPFDKQYYCFFPYLVCSILAIFVFSINSTWFKWKRPFVKYALTLCLVIIIFCLFFLFVENFGAYSGV